MCAIRKWKDADAGVTRLTVASAASVAKSAARRVRLALRVWVGASAKVVAELEGWSFEGDGACERE